MELSWDDTKAIEVAEPVWDDTKEIDTWSEAESAGLGALQGVTFGFSDEIGGLLGQTYNALKEGDFSNFKEGYKKLRNEYRQDQLEAMLANPKSYMAGELVGSVAVPGLGLAKGAATAAKIAARGTMAGAAFGAGSSNADLTEGEVGQFAADTAIGAGVGVLAGPASKIAKVGGEVVADKATKAVKKAISVATDKSIPNPIRNAKEIFTKGIQIEKDFMNKPIGDIISNVTERVKGASIKDAVGASGSITPFLIAPVSSTVALGAGMAYRKVKPLAVKQIKPIIEKYKPKKLIQMGETVGELMKKGGVELTNYLPTYERAISAMGIGGAGVVHTHLLKTDPEYRDIVALELKNQELNKTLLFNDKAN